MDTNKTFEDLVREEAHRIYEWRTFFSPPFPGDDVTDWLEAEENIREEQEAKALGISTTTVNRIKNLI
jgi:hypothetical protein